MHPEKLVMLDVVRVITVVELFGRKAWSSRNGRLRELEGEWLTIPASLQEEAVAIISHYGKFNSVKSYTDFVERWEAQCRPAYKATKATFVVDPIAVRAGVSGPGLPAYAVLLWLCREAAALYDVEMAAAQPGAGDFEIPNFQIPEGFPPDSVHWITTPLGMKVEPRELAGSTNLIRFIPN